MKPTVSEAREASPSNVFLTTGFKSGTETIVGILEAMGFQHRRIRESDGITDWKEADSLTLSQLQATLTETTPIVIAHHWPASDSMLKAIAAHRWLLWIHLRDEADSAASAYAFLRKLALEPRYRQGQYLTQEMEKFLLAFDWESPNDFRQFVLEQATAIQCFNNTWSTHVVASRTLEYAPPLALTNFGMFKSQGDKEMVKQVIERTGRNPAFLSPTPSDAASHRHITSGMLRKEARSVIKTSGLISGRSAAYRRVLRLRRPLLRLN